jgi:mono/diheme cytochrome c family protein
MSTLDTPAAKLRDSRILPISVTNYLLVVIVVTGLGFAAGTRVNPTLLHVLREHLGWERPAAATPNSFYAARVAPILSEHCTGCHGARRQKGGLRLDSFAALIDGGKHGPVVKAGNRSDSEIINRITLPSNNAKAMPPESKPPLSADEITVIKLWVAAGASGVLPVDAFKGAPNPVVKVKFPEIDAAQVHRQRAALAGIVATLQARWPGVISYESRESANLVVNASHLRGSFGDKDVDALAPLKDRIVWADLSGTAISDASASTLATLKHLRVLRLSDAHVTDATIESLMSLTELRSLTVVDTEVSEQALSRFRQKGGMVYLGRPEGTTSGAH